MSFQAAARASRAFCSDFMHQPKAPAAADDFSPIVSTLVFARAPQAFSRSILGRLSSFAIAANVAKRTTAAERTIVDFGFMLLVSRFEFTLRAASFDHLVG